MGLQNRGLTIVAILTTGLALANCVGTTDSGGSPTSPSQQQAGSVTGSSAANFIEAEGLIQSLTGSCPDLSLVVAARQVRTTSATEFNRIPCTLLQNGIDVEAEGTLDASGVLVAREVQPDEVNRAGTVAGLIGTCPDRRFNVDGTSVVALASTRFDDLSCVTLRDGLRVEVRGIRKADASLLLTRVKLREDTPGPRPQEQRVEGALTDLGGVCPARSFSVAGRPVTTTASTRFDDTKCADLQVGIRVEVRGFSQANGSIEATRVSKRTRSAMAARRRENHRGGGPRRLADVRSVA